MRSLGKVKIKWSPQFAYVIGLLTTDGCLSKDGRHVDLTSKDREQIENCLKCLNIKIKIGLKGSGSSTKKYLRIQIGDIGFYRFLLSIGLTPRKTKTLGPVSIPDKYFSDFLRGHLDGDGSFYSYWDPRWKSSFMFYTVFVSASEKHILWLRKEIHRFFKVKGAILISRKRSVKSLRFAKKESLKLLPHIYHKKAKYFLSRKYLKIRKCLGIIGKEKLI